MRPGLAKIVPHAAVVVAATVAVAVAMAAEVAAAADAVVVIPTATNQNIERRGFLRNRTRAHLSMHGKS